MLKLELNLILKFVSYEVIMPRNIFLDCRKQDKRIGGMDSLVFFIDPL